MQLTIKKFNENTLQIEDCGLSIKLSNDNEEYSSLNDWIKEVTPKTKLIKRTGNSSAIKFGKNEQNYDENSLGLFVNAANSCELNPKFVTIFSNCFDNATGYQPFIYLENIDRIVASFVARKSIEATWINNNDEYRVPLKEVQSSDKYKQFVNDAYIYSITHIHSFQTSMRHIKNFDDTYFNIFNHFFYTSNEEMKELADKYNFKEMYDDADEFYEDRFIYKKLLELNLSPDAKEILEGLRRLTIDSMKYRELAHQEDEKYHLNTWDAGWYQIRMGILKKYMPTELKAFMIKFKEFENRLRPMVYEFGFLPHENKLDS